MEDLITQLTYCAHVMGLPIGSDRLAEAINVGAVTLEDGRSLDVALDMARAALGSRELVAA